MLGISQLITRMKRENVCDTLRETIFVLEFSLPFATGLIGYRTRESQVDAPHRLCRANATNYDFAEHIQTHPDYRIS